METENNEKKKLRCLKFSFTEDNSGVVLNYITQSISEPLAQKDFVEQKNMAQNKSEFFWAIQALIGFNILLQIIIIFGDKPNKLGIMGISNTVIWLSFIWPICRWRFNKFTRFVFVGYYLTTSIMGLIM